MARTIRQGPFRDLITIVAPGRSRRSHTPVRTQFGETGKICPFCEGNEDQTLEEVFALRPTATAPNRPGWAVRVVPNRYPAVTRGSASVLTSQGLHQQARAVGVHELVIDTPVHTSRLTEFSVEKLQAVLAVYRARLDVHARTSGIRFIVLFRNDGRAAGASQDHPHSQILALPLVPPAVQRELAAAEEHLRIRNRCVTCEVLESESRDGPRVITRNGSFVAMTSFSGRFPYECFITPAFHAHDFRDTGDEQLRSLAEILKGILAGLELVLGRFSYNLMLQNCPPSSTFAGEHAFHWRLEILPRLSVPSGVELATDVYINPLSPEEAARDLRSALTRLQPPDSPTPLRDGSDSQFS